MAKDTTNFKAMSDAELGSELAGLENQLIQLRFDHASRGIANPMEIREMRREIARAHTETRSRQMSTMTAEELEMRSKLRARRRRQR
jgi:large subunit ribosomal protein L29